MFTFCILDISNVFFFVVLFSFLMIGLPCLFIVSDFLLFIPPCILLLSCYPGTVVSRDLCCTLYYIFCNKTFFVKSLLVSTFAGSTSFRSNPELDKDTIKTIETKTRPRLLEVETKTIPRLFESKKKHREPPT